MKRDLKEEKEDERKGMLSSSSLDRLDQLTSCTGGKGKACGTGAFGFSSWSSKGFARPSALLDVCAHLWSRSATFKRHGASAMVSMSY